VWNLARSADKAIEHVLHGHTRAITDINFHPDHPDLLATCSVDTFVLAWDTRQPKRPFFSVADWRAGASQVKWNFKNPNLLASSHDNYFYLWDLRNNAKPIYRVDAHERKINGVDFSRTTEHEIVSSSNDGTVKFWDLSKSTDTPTSIISTEFPVWRARHLPFGHGCAIMPLRGGNNAIYLANHSDLKGESNLKPSHVFKGHSDRVTDFLWRQRHSAGGVDDREFQLVTWSKDCDLRLWSLNDELYEKLDFHRGEPMDLEPYDYRTYSEEPGTEDNQLTLKKTKDTFVSSRGQTTNTDDHLNWISGVRIGRSAFAPPQDQNPNSLSMDNTPDNLGEEVSVVGHKFPKVRFEKISVSTGTLILSLNGPWTEQGDDLVFLRVEIKFPKEYPSKPPKFSIEENRDLTYVKRQEILTNLNEITAKHAEFAKFSLEPCLRFLMGEKIDLDNLYAEDEAESLNFSQIEDLDTSMPSSVPSSEDEEDELIPMRSSVLATVPEPSFDSTPIPKGCGASWTKTGQLVCFFIPKQEQKAAQRVMKFDQGGFSNQVLYDDDQLSDDSLNDDWNDILQKDVTTRSKLPGVFKIQNYRQKDSLPTEKSNNTQAAENKNVVAIFDFKDLIPSKMELAEEYRVTGGAPDELASHNADICAKYGYTDLYDSWRVLSFILKKDFYWGVHPFGRTWLIKEMMSYYEKLGNVQMLAMMSCILCSVSIVEEPTNNTPLEEGSFRNYRVTSMSDTTGSNYSESNYKLPFSRSSSIIGEQKPTVNVKIEMFNEVSLGYSESSFGITLIDADDQRYNRYRDEYANILYTWGHILRRAEILKFNYELSIPVTDEYKGRVCWNIEHLDNCAYCGLKMKRRVFSCHKCEHVLHADCASDWWRQAEECASGCGCECLKPEE
jgi:WD40 repeat protein